MKEFFGLSCRYEDMSPVLIPAGYTRDYIDGKIAAGDQLKDVHTAFEASKAFRGRPDQKFTYRSFLPRTRTTEYFSCLCLVLLRCTSQNESTPFTARVTWRSFAVFVS